MIAFLSSSWTWICGVAPYVGAFALVGLGGIFFVAIILQARHKQQQKRWAESIKPGKGWGV